MGPAPQHAFGGIPQIIETLQRQGYIADRDVAMSIYLSVVLRKPLLIEGAAGVGKTEVAKVMASALDTDLIRLQCYEGLDVHTALYEWNYQRQMLRIKLEETSGRPAEEKEHLIFSEPFMLKRPLLQAITAERASVLLIDEVDRADEEFEAFLLEVLSDFQVSIPELGTIRARHIPYVVLTSNRTRDLGDALRRRCLYLWIDYPTFEKELTIIHRKVPGINERLAQRREGRPRGDPRPQRRAVRPSAPGRSVRSGLEYPGPADRRLHAAGAPRRPRQSPGHRGDPGLERGAAGAPP